MSKVQKRAKAFLSAALETGSASFQRSALSSPGLTAEDLVYLLRELINRPESLAEQSLDGEQIINAVSETIRLISVEVNRRKAESKEVNALLEELKVLIPDLAEFLKRVEFTCSIALLMRAFSELPEEFLILFLDRFPEAFLRLMDCLTELPKSHIRSIARHILFIRPEKFHIFWESFLHEMNLLEANSLVGDSLLSSLFLDGSMSAISSGNLGTKLSASSSKFLQLLCSTFSYRGCQDIMVKEDSVNDKEIFLCKSVSMVLEVIIIETRKKRFHSKILNVLMQFLPFLEERYSLWLPIYSISFLIFENRNNAGFVDYLLMEEASLIFLNHAIRKYRIDLDCRDTWVRDFAILNFSASCVISSLLSTSSCHRSVCSEILEHSKIILKQLVELLTSDSSETSIFDCSKRNLFIWTGCNISLFQAQISLTSSLWAKALILDAVQFYSYLDVHLDSVSSWQSSDSLPHYGFLSSLIFSDYLSISNSQVVFRILMSKKHISLVPLLPILVFHLNSLSHSPVTLLSNFEVLSELVIREVNNPSVEMIAPLIIHILNTCMSISRSFELISICIRLIGDIYVSHKGSRTAGSSVWRKLRKILNEKITKFSIKEEQVRVSLAKVLFRICSVDPHEGLEFVPTLKQMLIDPLSIVQALALRSFFKLCKEDVIEFKPLIQFIMAKWNLSSMSSLADSNLSVSSEILNLFRLYQGNSNDEGDINMAKSIMELSLNTLDRILGSKSKTALITLVTNAISAIRNLMSLFLNQKSPDEFLNLPLNPIQSIIQSLKFKSVIFRLCTSFELEDRSSRVLIELLKDVFSYEIVNIPSSPEIPQSSTELSIRKIITKCLTGIESKYYSCIKPSQKRALCYPLLVSQISTPKKDLFKIFCDIIKDFDSSMLAGAKFWFMHHHLESWKQAVGLWMDICLSKIGTQSIDSAEKEKLLLSDISLLEKKYFSLESHENSPLVLINLNMFQCALGVGLRQRFQNSKYLLSIWKSTSDIIQQRMNDPLSILYPEFIMDFADLSSYLQFTDVCIIDESISLLMRCADIKVNSKDDCWAISSSIHGLGKIIRQLIRLQGSSLGLNRKDSCHFSIRKIFELISSATKTRILSSLSDQIVLTGIAASFCEFYMTLKNIKEFSSDISRLIVNFREIKNFIESTDDKFVPLLVLLNVVIALVDISLVLENGNAIDFTVSHFSDLLVCIQSGESHLFSVKHLANLVYFAVIVRSKARELLPDNLLREYLRILLNIVKADQQDSECVIISSICVEILFGSSGFSFLRNFHLFSSDLIRNHPFQSTDRYTNSNISEDQKSFCALAHEIIESLCSTFNDKFQFESPSEILKSSISCWIIGSISSFFSINPSNLRQNSLPQGSLVLKCFEEISSDDQRLSSTFARIICGSFDVDDETIQKYATSREISKLSLSSRLFLSTSAFNRIISSQSTKTDVMDACIELALSQALNNGMETRRYLCSFFEFSRFQSLPILLKSSLVRIVVPELHRLTSNEMLNEVIQVVVQIIMLGFIEKTIGELHIEILESLSELISACFANLEKQESNSDEVLIRMHSILLKKLLPFLPIDWISDSYLCKHTNVHRFMISFAKCLCQYDEALVTNNLKSNVRFDLSSLETEQHVRILFSRSFYRSALKTDETLFSEKCYINYFQILCDNFIPYKIYRGLTLSLVKHYFHFKFCSMTLAAKLNHMHSILNSRSFQSQFLPSTMRVIGILNCFIIIWTRPGVFLDDVEDSRCWSNAWIHGPLLLGNLCKKMIFQSEALSLRVEQLLDKVLELEFNLCDKAAMKLAQSWRNKVVLNFPIRSKKHWERFVKAELLCD